MTKRDLLEQCIPRISPFPSFSFSLSLPYSLPPARPQLFCHVYRFVIGAQRVLMVMMVRDWSLGFRV